MSDGVSFFIIAFTSLNVLACLWLIWWTSHRREEQSVDLNVEKTGHVWDGDLEEYNNPLPRWWLGLFVITIIFAGAYLVLYPGLGTYPGVLKWSSKQEHATQAAAQRQLFEHKFAAVETTPLDALSHDPSAMLTASNLFATTCAQCHGSDARGAKGFPNLTDNDWLWGGDAATIYQTITQGRHGSMPAWKAVLQDTGVNETASYVLSLSGRAAPPDWVAAGKARFAMLCVGCHGVDAKGNRALGAPDLTDGVWLHGGDFDSVRTTIANGRESQMPAQGVALGDTKVRLLAAYVLSLSQPTAPLADNTPQVTVSPETSEHHDDAGR